MAILLYIEHQHHTIKKSVLEAASYGRQLADQLQTVLHAVLIGDLPDDIVQELGKFGIEKLWKTPLEESSQFKQLSYTTIIYEVAEKSNAQFILFANSYEAKGITPRIAIKLNAALINNVISIPKIEEGNIQVKTAAYSNKALAEVRLQSEKVILTIAPNTFNLFESPKTLEIVNYQREHATIEFDAVVKEIVQATGQISLPEAEIVVSAGRGLKGPENWGMIEELASLLGAATACSKPVSDAGWRPHAEHVGQTGLSVNPKLYIAIGISGAIQHLAGVSNSKTIIVINKDPEAPFFKIADYGIVGDAFDIVPKLIAGIKAKKN